LRPGTRPQTQAAAAQYLLTRSTAAAPTLSEAKGPILFDPGTPYTAAELRASLERLLIEGTTRLGGVSEAAFFAPQGDRWSPAEHIRHLRKSTAPVARALRLPRLVLRFKFGIHRDPSRTFVPLRDWYLSKLSEFGNRPNRFAPGPDASTRDAARRAAIMASWQTSAADIDAATRSWSESALDKYRLPHPLLGPLSLREMVEFTVYHTSHHLNLLTSRLP
jgi:hypothetical protein